MNLRSNPGGPGIPLVIQVGFAGSRKLIDDAAITAAEASLFDAQLTQRLIERLERLKTELHAVEQCFFFCGISQLATGADTIFTRACQASKTPQRILLPQPLEEYLNAVGPTGVADFSEEQRQIARELLKSSHIINHRVVSTAGSRGERFEDVNLEIAQMSDVTVCLVRADIQPRRGGTQDLIDRARLRGKPVLEISVALDGRRLVLSDTWHGLEEFRLPALPCALRDLTMVPEFEGTVPTPAEYLRKLKSFTSAQAKKRSTFFFSAALIIIASHVGATISAVIFLQNREHRILGLLVAELLLLVLGFTVHHYLHRSEASHVWAVSRLIAETTRSIGALCELRVYLAYLFWLPFPAELRPLLRTLDVLQLKSAHAAPGRSWQALRTTYLRDRLTGANAQLDFYARKSANSIRWLKLARWTFAIFSVGAFFAALTELLMVSSWLEPIPWREAWCGPLAIVLPVLAVGALSLAAAFDFEARVQTFRDMLAFLRTQMNHVENATSEREFTELVLETESRLLGETVSWLSRRSFTEVA